MTTGIVIAIMWLLQFGDFWSTRRALRRPQVREGNPLVRGMGLVAAKLLAGSLMTIALLWAGPVSLLQLLIFVGPLCAWYIWVIYHNVTVSART
jgi:hypothetical protein